ncbi:MAG: carboxyl transferase [Ruminococcus sp.]|nr:carboxyl transferase [Ruminococcus sp.]
MSESIKSLAELTAAVSAESKARTRLTYLFDEGKFTELDAFVGNGSEPVGVVTAYGYCDGEPVYAFSQNIEIRSGALTKEAADKIVKVYDLAAKTGFPVVGIYDSYGADVSDSAGALKAYGELLLCSANLSGVVPTVAVIAGTCAGAAAMLAESADFAVMAKDAELYVYPNSAAKGSAENAAANGTVCAVEEDDKAAVEKAREILLKLPQNNLSPVPVYEYEEPSGFPAGDIESVCRAVFDKDSLTELSAGYGTTAFTALASVNGETVGIAASNKTKGRLTADDCAKLARFVRTCDAFAVPLVTFVDTEGFAADDSTEVQGAVKSMSKLSHAYSEATTAKIAVVTGKAYGPAYMALAGKGANSDVAYALPEAVIAALDPVTAVEFMQHDELKGAEDLESARNALADKYAREQASAVNAAVNGLVDGIIQPGGLRSALVDALAMLSGKRISRLPKKHSNIQL